MAIRSNEESTFFKNLTASVLRIFNENVYYFSYIDGEDKPPHYYRVPFFYSFSNDSNFMKEFFYLLPDECDVTAEGNYDSFPRGSMKLSEFEIRSDDLTNKFVRGTYSKEEYSEGNQQPIIAPYSAYLFSIPLNVQYDFEIRAEHYNQTFKIVENILKVLYKNRVVYFNHNGLMHQSQIQLPESYSKNKSFDFSYDQDQLISVQFSINVEAYMPSFTEETEMSAGSVIKQFNYYIDQMTEKHDAAGGGPIESSYNRYINNLEFEVESLREAATIDFQLGNNDGITIANTLNATLNPNDVEELKKLIK
jgi:hypothetical protein